MSVCTEMTTIVIETGEILQLQLDLELSSQIAKILCVKFECDSRKKYFR